MIQDILRDNSRFLAEAPIDVGKYELLHLVADALRRDSQFLTEHPTAVFQSLANSLSFNEQAVNPILAALLQSWRSQSVPCRRPWLRSLSPLPAAVDSPVVQVLTHHGQVQAISTSPDGKLVAVASAEKGAGIHTRIWSTGAWELVVDLQPLEAENAYAGVRWLGFDHRSERLFLVAYSGGLYCFELELGDQYCWTQYMTEPVRYAALSPDSPLLAICDTKNVIRIWNLSESTFQDSFSVTYNDEGTNDVSAMAFSRDGKYLAAGGGSAVLVWKTSDGALRKGFPDRLTGYCNGLIFTPDGRHLIAAGGEDIGNDDAKLCMWSVRTGQPADPTPDFGTEPYYPIHSCACHPSEPLIAGVGDGFNAVALWSSSTGELQNVGEQYCGAVEVVAFDIDGSHLLVGTFRGDVYVLDAAEARVDKYQRMDPNRLNRRNYVSRMEWLEFVPHSRHLLGVEFGRVKAFQLDDSSARQLDDRACDPFHGAYDPVMGIETVRTHGGNAEVAFLIKNPRYKEGVEVHVYDFGKFPGTPRFHRSFALPGYEPLGLTFDHHSGMVISWYKSRDQLNKSECTVCFAAESSLGGEVAGELIEFPLVIVDAVAISDEYVVFAHEKGLILWSKVMNAECDAYEERLRIAQCAVSPDGQWLAVFQGEHSRFGRDEPEKIAWWKIGLDQLVRIGRTRQYSGGIAKSPDGRFHAVYERRSDHRWGTKLVILPGARSRIGHSPLVRCAGRLWLTTDDQRHLRVCEGKTGKLTCTIQLPLPIIAIAASDGAEGYAVAATMNSGDVVAFRVEEMQRNEEDSP